MFSPEISTKIFNTYQRRLYQVITIWNMCFILGVIAVIFTTKYNFWWINIFPLILIYMCNPRNFVWDIYKGYLKKDFGGHLLILTIDKHKEVYEVILNKITLDETKINVFGKIKY